MGGPADGYELPVDDVVRELYVDRAGDTFYGRPAHAEARGYAQYVRTDRTRFTLIGLLK